MKTDLVSDKISRDSSSWAEDFTHSRKCRQQFMYVQSMGHYHATPVYGVHERSGLHSFLLLHTLSGNGVIRYRGQECCLSAGSCVFIDCTLPHSYYCDQDSLWDFEWIHFSGDCMDGYASNILENWRPVITENAEDIFRRIMELGGRYDMRSEILCSTLLIDLCTRILTSLLSPTDSVPLVSSPVVRRAIEWLEENYTAEICLDDLASFLGLNKYYLSHLFCQQVGQSPYEYLMNYRLSAAKHLLRGSDESINSVAEQTGFGSSSHFIQVFRSREGQTPLSYRRHLSDIREN